MSIEYDTCSYKPIKAPRRETPILHLVILYIRQLTRLLMIGQARTLHNGVIHNDNTSASGMNNVYTYEQALTLQTTGHPSLDYKYYDYIPQFMCMFEDNYMMRGLFNMIVRQT